MMKRTENFRIGRKNFTVVVLAFVLVISAMLAGCGSSAAETTSGSKEEVVVDKVEEKTAEEVAQAETVVEEVDESTEEVVGPQSAKEWAQSVDTTEPKMTIWNDTLKEGIILEDGQKYVLRQDDTILFCTKEKQSGISLDADIAGEDFEFRTTDKYVKIQLNKILTKETLFKVRITVAGTEYTFSVTLISESATDSVAEESESTDMSGKDWASSLNYEEPKLIAWNDETGTKEVIDNGGSYQMQSGDMLGIYHSEKYFPVRTDPFEFCEGFNAGLTYSMMICNLPEESQTINLGLELLDREAENFVTYYFTITTP